MNTAVNVSVTDNASAEVKVKKTRGAKPNPNSKYNQSRRLIQAMPESERVRKNVLAVLGRELGLSDKVASVYFYNIREEIRKASATV